MVGMVRPVHALPAIVIVIVLSAHDRRIADAHRKRAHLINVCIDLNRVVVADIHEHIPVHPAARATRSAQLHDRPAERDFGMVRMRVLDGEKAGVIASRRILREDRRGKKRLDEQKSGEENLHGAVFARHGRSRFAAA